MGEPSPKDTSAGRSGSPSGFYDEPVHAAHPARLAATTAQIWWRTLPATLSWLLAAWLLAEVALWGAAMLIRQNSWLALVVFSLGLVATVVATVAALHILGREWLARTGRPAPEPTAAGTPAAPSNRLTDLVAVTLLPLLGIYAAFDKVRQRAAELELVDIWLANPTLDDHLSDLLDPTRNGSRLGIAVAVIVGAYLLRRSLELLGERSGRTLLGLVGAFFEAFFLLTLILVGGRVLELVRNWLAGRQVTAWVEGFLRGIAQLFGHPDFFARLWRFWSETAWPTLGVAVFEPLLWLAVAALVFGTGGLSVAELWRHRSDAPAVERRRLRRLRESGTVRRGWLEFQEAFLGDIDDRYVPTFQALRLVVRPGLLFLAGFLFGYGLLRLLTDFAATGAYVWLIGERPAVYAFAAQATSDVLMLPLEALRLALLTVAFQVCLAWDRRRSAPEAAAAEPGEPEPLAVNR